MKTIASLVLVTLAFSLKAQISMVKDVPSLKEAIKGNDLIIVTSDTLMQRLYKQVFKNNWPFGSVKFENPENYVANLEVGKFYLQSIDAVFVGHHEGPKENGTYYTTSHKYLTFYIANELYVDTKKHNVEVKHFNIDQCIVLPLEKKFMDGDGSRRYNFGILKNNLQQIKTCFDTETGSVFYNDFSNKEKLAQLKNQTLYIVVDDPKKVPFKEELAVYPYDYKFVSNKELEDAILCTDKEFYYMHFAYTPAKAQIQIGIVNSLTGEEIFHDKMMSMDGKVFLSDRRINFLAKKIDGK